MIISLKNYKIKWIYRQLLDRAEGFCRTLEGRWALGDCGNSVLIFIWKHYKKVNIFISFIFFTSFGCHFMPFYMFLNLRQRRELVLLNLSEIWMSRFYRWQCTFYFVKMIEKRFHDFISVYLKLFVRKVNFMDSWTYMICQRLNWSYCLSITTID